MPIQAIIQLLLTHGLPIFIFMYMIVHVLQRNKRKTEHILVAAISFAYMLLFVEEIVRNLVDIKYSPMLSSYWFSSIGLLSICLGLHFILATTKVNKNLPSYAIGLICYSPLIIVLLNILSGAQMFSTQTFEYRGMWIYPIYNANYYITLTGSIVANLLILTVLYLISKRTTNLEEKKAQRILLRGMTHVAIITLLLGVLPLQSLLPPFPYIYAGIYFCYILMVMMSRYQFLEQHDKRYEKLFTMNPDAIILLDNHLNIREVNPVAERFLAKNNTSIEMLSHQLNDDEQYSLRHLEKIENMQVNLELNGKKYIFLLNVDQITVNFEAYRFIIIRDITKMKQQQDEIFYLAYHDTLTGLPNRRYIFEQLEKRLEEMDDENEVLALYLIDMNNLKMLNDIIGHDAGDEAIKILANVLKKINPEDGMAARIGGDEFMVFINESRSNITEEKFIQVVKSQFKFATKHFEHIPIGISIGCGHYPNDSRTIDNLVMIADQKMYEMKKLKKVHYR